MSVIEDMESIKIATAIMEILEDINTDECISTVIMSEEKRNEIISIIKEMGVSKYKFHVKDNMTLYVGKDME